MCCRDSFLVSYPRHEQDWPLLQSTKVGEAPVLGRPLLQAPLSRAPLWPSFSPTLEFMEDGGRGDL